MSSFDTHAVMEWSAGMRLGFVTGPQPLLEIIDLHTSNTNLQPS